MSYLLYILKLKSYNNNQKYVSTPHHALRPLIYP